MKFDESQISASKRAEWAAAERDYLSSAPDVGAPVTFQGRRMMWFVGADLHVDGYVWANCYDLEVQSDQRAISQHINKLLGDVRIVFEEELL